MLDPDYLPDYIPFLMTMFLHRHTLSVYDKCYVTMTYKYDIKVSLIYVSNDGCTGND